MRKKSKKNVTDYIRGKNKINKELSGYNLQKIKDFTPGYIFVIDSEKDCVHEEIIDVSKLIDELSNDKKS